MCLCWGGRNKGRVVGGRGKRDGDRLTLDGRRRVYCRHGCSGDSGVLRVRWGIIVLRILYGDVGNRWVGIVLFLPQDRLGGSFRGLEESKHGGEKRDTRVEKKSARLYTYWWIACS